MQKWNIFKFLGKYIARTSYSTKVMKKVFESMIICYYDKVCFTNISTVYTVD